MSSYSKALDEYSSITPTSSQYASSDSSDAVFTNSIPDENSFPQMYYQEPIPYYMQADGDWAHSPSPSLAPSTPPKSASLPLLFTSVPFDTTSSNWSTSTGVKTNDETNQPGDDVQRVSDAKTRRRQQNRDSQRAFRERKNRHIEQLEHALADLQCRHEKLLQCFVGLTERVSGEGAHLHPYGNFRTDPRYQVQDYAGSSTRTLGATGSERLNS